MLYFDALALPMPQTWLFSSGLAVISAVIYPMLLSQAQKLGDWKGATERLQRTRDELNEVNEQCQKDIMSLLGSSSQTIEAAVEKATSEISSLDTQLREDEALRQEAVAKEANARDQKNRCEKITWSEKQKVTSCQKQVERQEKKRDDTVAKQQK